MAEELVISQHLSKKERYKTILPQISALIEGETDVIANISNIIAVLKSSFNFLWVGCYFVKGNELVLGPFQGPIACTRIAKGKGVCGTAWTKKETIIVPDVTTFSGHIACSSSSKSEIVVPILNQQKEVFLVLDIDSDQLNTFDEVDQNYLSEIAKIIESFL